VVALFVAYNIFRQSYRNRKDFAMTIKLKVLLICIGLSCSAFADSKPAKRLADSTAVLQSALEKNEIPKGVLDKAACVLIYPSVKKVGVGLGVSYGRGVLTCRTGAKMTDGWSAPAMYTLDTGSLGPQLGSTATDYVLLVMTERAADKVLSGKLKLGADASAVAGPSGANASGFNDPNVDVLSYSRSKGLFAGASLGSASMGTDNEANKDLYGKSVDATQIVRDGAVSTSEAGKALVDLLEKASPKRIQ
jgi:lipid-binding SYLF domain-containing protein